VEKSIKQLNRVSISVSLWLRLGLVLGLGLGLGLGLVLDRQHQDVDRTPRETVNTEDRDKWRKYVHGVTNPRIKDD